MEDHLTQVHLFADWCPLFGSFWEQCFKSDDKNRCQELIKEARTFWGIPEFFPTYVLFGYPTYDDIVLTLKNYPVYHNLPPIKNGQIVSCPPRTFAAAKCIFQKHTEIRLYLTVDSQDYFESETGPKPKKDLDHIPVNRVVDVVRNIYLGRNGFSLNERKSISEVMILSILAICEAWEAYELLSSNSSRSMVMGNQSLNVAASLMVKARAIEAHKREEKARTSIPQSGGREASEQHQNAYRIITDYFFPRLKKYFDMTGNNRRKKNQAVQIFSRTLLWADPKSKVTSLQDKEILLEVFKTEEELKEIFKDILSALPARKRALSDTKLRELASPFFPTKKTPS